MKKIILMMALAAAPVIFAQSKSERTSEKVSSKEVKASDEKVDTPAANAEVKATDEKAGKKVEAKASAKDEAVEKEKAAKANEESLKEE